MDGGEYPRDCEGRASILLQQSPLLSQKLVRNCGLADPGSCQRALIEVLRFLCLCDASAKALTPSIRVDAVWHEFILFTRLYERYCNEVFGRFIHHQPDDDSDQTGKQYLATLAAYRSRFGEPNPEFWPEPGVASSDCGPCEN